MEKNLALMLYSPLTHFLATNNDIQDREVMVNTGHTVMLTKNVNGMYSQNTVMLPWLISDMEIPNSEFYNTRNYSGNELFHM
jgi:hypothetical protein